MSPTAQKTAAAPEDPFADLQIIESDEPLPSIVRGGQQGPNPFADKVEASVQHNTSYSFYLDPKQVTRAVFLINAAAKRLNYGVRVWVNVKRDNGKVVKGSDGKAQHVTETSGPNKGKVLVRFQGKPERKTQTAPRPFSIVRDKKNPNLYYLRPKGDKKVLLQGDHEKVKAEYDRLTAAARNTETQSA